MKVFFFMGRNPKNRSGVSWKIWKVVRHKRSVTTHWGPAVLRGRKPVPASYMQSKTRRFKTAFEAITHEKQLVEAKLKKGYERRPRWR